MTFGPRLFRGQRLAQRRLHLADIVGAVDVAHPADAHALHRLGDRMLGRFRAVRCPRRQDVLAAGRGGVEIVDDDDDAVILVEDGVADRRGQAVVPEAAVADEGDRTPRRLRRVERRGRGRPEPVAHGGGAELERRHDREQMAADVGRDVVLPELLLDQLGGGEDRPLRAADAEARRAAGNDADEVGDFVAVAALVGRPHLARQHVRRLGAQEGADAVQHDLAGIFAGHRQMFLADDPGAAAGLVQHRGHRLLDVVGLAFLDHQHRILAFAERQELVVDQRIDGVQHVERNLGLAISVGKADALQRPDHRIVHAALHDDADRAVLGAEELVDLAAADEVDGRRPALLDLFLLVQEGGRRQHDAAGVAARRRQRLGHRHLRPLVVLRREMPVHVAAADAHQKHDRRVRGFGQLEAVLDRLDDRRQVGPGVEQPDLALHGEGVAALLHDRGALAIILADDDQRAAGDAARGEIGQRVGRDIGADRRLEGRRAADRIVHRSRQHGGRRRFRGARLEMHAELAQNVLRVGQHVHQMADRRALVAADIADAALQQRLGDGEDAFAGKFLAGAEPQLFDFLDKGPFGHLRSPPRFTPPARGGRRPFRCRACGCCAASCAACRSAPRTRRRRCRRTWSRTRRAWPARRGRTRRALRRSGRPA